MEAIPAFAYQIEHNPEPEKIGIVEIYSTFVRPVDMEPILTRSRFSCSLSTKEFNEDDDDSPHKQELYYFLTEAGVDEQDAVMLMLKFIGLAREVISSVVYRPQYALFLWLTLDVVPSTEGSFLNDSQIDEVIRASLVEYERNSGLRPANKLRVDSLNRRRYKRKRGTSSIADQCTICLKKYKTGRELRTLPCGHEFDNKCIVRWLKVSHVCPLCRFKLPCEDDQKLVYTN